MSRYWPAIIPSVGVRELARDVVRVVREREAERLGEERVAREERDALAERDVRARPTAPLVVVVERGKVVVDERERVHELERGRRRAAPRRPSLRLPPRPRGTEPAGSRFPPASSG